MSSTDVSRAYKNFKSDPLDWPLLCFKWRDQYYSDVTTPFGGQSPSCHMQRVADAIIAMLGRRGIMFKMYLDDWIILSPSYDKAVADLQTAQDLLRQLGLPEAVNKIHHPASNIKSLGVDIEAKNMTLSLPNDRLVDIKRAVYLAIMCRRMSKLQLQSLLGKLLNVAKCVASARLFVARLLVSLRNMTGLYLQVDEEMKIYTGSMSLCKRGMV